MAHTDGTIAIASNEPSVVVPIEVAAREGVDPIELTPPLHDVVDPDALDALFARSDTRDQAVVVTFEYCGYTVEIGGDGSVDVRD